MFLDGATGLYYDPSSSYYYNSELQKYMYYDYDQMKYIFAPESSETQSGNKKTETKKDLKHSAAEQVMKDMERWEKISNQKKSVVAPPRTELVTQVPIRSGSENVAFSVVERKSSFPSFFEDPNSGSPLNAYHKKCYVDGESVDDFLDLDKVVCNLCKRQLPSLEILLKHAKFSELHKKNLEEHKANALKDQIVYRDRAKERRMKFADTNQAPRDLLKEEFLRAKEHSVASTYSGTSSTAPIGPQNVGNQLLQKMGWSDGQGLGKTNQGITSIIQVPLIPIAISNYVMSLSLLGWETQHYCRIGK